MVCPSQCHDHSTSRELADGAGLFQYVMDSSGPCPHTLRLEGILTALYGDYRATLQAVLASNSSSSMRRPLKEKFCGIESIGEVDIMEQTPEALVSGWNRLFDLS